MIAVSSSGTGFRALATYLMHGRTGLEEGRIGWASARNLPTDDPELAATLMRATAAQNVRVEKPVYHLALAFDPGDSVDRATMERVADRVLARLGLEEHQGLIVSHRDREHPHLHILVNRVHPETGKVWDRWQDMPAIQQVLREEERALGLRAVPGHLHVGDVAREAERAPDEVSRTPGGARDRAIGEAALLASSGADSRGATESRSPEQSAGGVASRAESTPANGARELVARARELLPAVREVGTWNDVDRTLADAGLRLERRGCGLVVTDGERYAKASGIGPDLTLRRLEARLGARALVVADAGVRAVEASASARHSAVERWVPDHRGEGNRDRARDLALPSRDAQPSALAGSGAGRVGPDVQVPPFSPIVDGVSSPALQRVARDLAQLARVRELAVEQRGAAQSLAAERARLAALNAAVERQARTDRALDAAFARVYAHPVRARASFEASSAVDGIDQAATRLRERPESFGELAAAERSRAFGLVRQRDETMARQVAREAGTLAVERDTAGRGVAAVLEESGVGSSNPPRVSRPGIAGVRVQQIGAVEAATARERAVRAERRGLPGAEVLERGLREAMRKLTPTEVQHLQAMLTRPQMALAMRVRQTVKEAMLGREAGP